VLSVVYQCERVDGRPRLLDASVTSTVACVDEDSPCFLGCSVFGQVLLHTCILETGSGSLLSEDSDATFLLESFIQSWFTHVTTRFLQEQGLCRYFYDVKVDDYQVVCRRSPIK